MEQRAVAELEALREIGKVLWLGTDINKAFTSTLTILGLTLEMENGTLSLFDPVTGEVFVEAAPEMADEERILGRLRPGEGIIGRIFHTGMPMVVPDIAAEPLFLNRTGSWRNLEDDPRAFIGVPIRSGRVTVGVLTVDRRYAAGPISFDRDVRFLEVVAGMAGVRVRLQEFEGTRRSAAIESEPGVPEIARGGVVAVDRRMREVLDRVERAARSRATVFLRGESGTGKEVVARTVHEASPRARRPFVAVSCAALAESLLESELFGHEKGAFTGASSAQKGRFEMADGGTLFLDEVGELSLAAQAKLLRVLQERQFERVGGRRTVTVDVRLVAATNRDMEDAVRNGRFRLDLYHRLSVVTVTLPPLRERPDDIPALAEHFLRELSRDNGREVRLAPDALAHLVRCRWSGNVRQLRNCLERGVVSTDRTLLTAADVDCAQGDGTACLLERISLPVGAAAPASLMGSDLAARAPGQSGATSPIGDELVGSEPVPRGAVPPEEDEGSRIRRALERCGFVKAKAARLLGMTERQLRYRVRKYGVPLERL
ncbi:MAG: nif-specific transcriptional activator NifA [Anaeromyxobacter sp. RBG_16_69_14]|nr:MAG: nif-specific transcriptional activator NifA [Anaeromyxobacter sp. RBG_16_69_14]